MTKADAGNDMERETNYINNLGREIIQECSALGIYVTTELVIHLVKLKLLNPRNGFFVSRIMSRELTQKFVRTCVADLGQVSPVTDCIRLQAYWQAVTPKLDEVRTVYSTHLLEKSQSALNDVLYVDEDDKVLRKMAVFANVFTNIGNANLQLNVKETMHPLKSVVRDKDLEHFFTLNETGKFEFLKHVSKLVSGIRIYQHYYKKGSENVDHAPLLLVSATNSIIEDLENWQEKITHRMEILVKELFYVYGAMPGMADKEIPPGFGPNDFLELQRIHHIMLQHLTYVRTLLSYLEDFIVVVQQLTDDLVQSVEKLNETIGCREVIPTSEVYDQFTTISDQWSALQAESCYLICVGLMVKNMYIINKYFPLTKLEIALGLVDREIKITDEREKNRRIYLQSETHELAMHRLTDGDVLQFRGFCPWTLITTDGALIPARTELGVLKYQNNYYGFVSSEAADYWKVNPELNVRRAYEVIRRNPEMVELLDLYDYLYDLRSEILVKDQEEREENMQSRAVQTVLHPVPRYRDKDYSFSEWELRYKAIQLSRIVKCRTKSVQTSGHSHFRASIGVQCSGERTQATETTQERGSVHEAVRNYLWGLRGGHDGAGQALALTRPVRESFQQVLPTGERPCNEVCPPPAKATGEATPVATGSGLIRSSFQWDEYDYMNIMKQKQTLYSNDYW